MTSVPPLGTGLWGSQWGRRVLGVASNSHFSSRDLQGQKEGNYGVGVGAGGLAAGGGKRVGSGTLST